MSTPLPSGMRDDSAIWPIMSELAACLCAELAVGGEPLCFCGVLPNRQVPVLLDDDCTNCGAGYVRLANAYPSTQVFPQPDEAPTCRSILAFSVIVGVARCSPMGDASHEPSPEDLADHARQIFADMAAIRRAIRCCLTDDKFEDIQYVLGTYTPLGGEDGVDGGEWELTIGELI